jgi:hypothetical protein
MLPQAECFPIPQSIFRNITLRNVEINNLITSPGVIMGSTQSPIDNIHFDGVRVSSACSAARSHDRLESFPGLLHEIDDPYVVQFYLLLAAATILPLLLLALCLCTCARAKEEGEGGGKGRWRVALRQCCTDGRRRFWTRWKAAALLLLVFVPILAILAAVMPGIAGTNDTSE